MPVTTAGKNKQAAAIAYDFASLHTADPTDDGSEAEISTVRTQAQIDAGKPAYARKAITLAAPVAGLRESNSPVFDVPEGVTVTHFCLWEGATCMVSEPVQNAEAFAGVGNYTLTDADVQTG